MTCRISSSINLKDSTGSARKRYVALGTVAYLAKKSPLPMLTVLLIKVSMISSMLTIAVAFPCSWIGTPKMERFVSGAGRATLRNVSEGDAGAYVVSGRGSIGGEGGVVVPAAGFSSFCEKGPALVRAGAHLAIEMGDLAFVRVNLLA